MMAGVNDFDTAKPNGSDVSKSTDPFRATVYKNPDKDWSPYDLMTLPWVANGKMQFAPGSRTDYSSTNFILLGLVIAATKNVAWDELDQSAFLPPAAIAAGLLKNTKFAAKGAPSEYSKVIAYDRTSYNGHNDSALPGIPVSDVHGVL
jgi:CubicO group peptidase (beta-lactamase class C family)